jgi:hypothetical protein
MLSSVLNSERAITVDIEIMRAFVRIRELLASDKALAAKFAQLERKLATHDQAITGILSAIRELMNPPAPQAPWNRVYGRSKGIAVGPPG